jgi:hypothetical protein
MPTWIAPANRATEDWEGALRFAGRLAIFVSVIWTGLFLWAASQHSLTWPAPISWAVGIGLFLGLGWVLGGFKR